MKRVKISLIGVSIVAFIGAMLAVKAARLDRVYVHDPSDGRTSACTKPLDGYTTLPNGAFVTYTLASTTMTTSGCHLVYLYIGE